MTLPKTALSDCVEEIKKPVANLSGSQFFNSHQPLDVPISLDFRLTITPSSVVKLHDRVNVARRAAGSLKGFPVTSAV